jgi:hypothetical protein
MRKITEIYEEYKIMPNLQMHQLRVTAVAWLLCESLNIEVDKKSIVTACLLHDMGNLVKFDLSYTQREFPEFLEPEGLEYWQGVQSEYFSKYGKDEHKATVDIMKEIGVSEYIVDLASHVNGTFIEQISQGEDFGQKICMYADDRVTPHGIVSVEERNLEAEKRYQNHEKAFDKEKREFFMKNIFDIEKQIFFHSNIKPEDINDESVAGIIEELKNFEI